VSKFDLAVIIAAVAGGALWIEHRHHVVIDAPASAELAAHAPPAACVAGPADHVAMLAVVGVGSRPSQRRAAKPAMGVHGRFREKRCAASHQEVGMNVLGRRGSLASVIVGATCILSTALWAGGAGFGDDDDNSEEEGPSYFGFVKDTNGSTMPDAKVTVGIKDRGGVVTRTDALGAYKVPGFGKEVDPKDVEIACDKQGYKQIRILRRMRSPTADVKIPIETECTLQRI